MRDYDRLVQRLRELRDAHHTAAQIAEKLNQEGYHPTGRRPTFSALTVRQLLSRWGLSGNRHESVVIQPNEWWLSDLAQAPRVTRHRASLDCSAVGPCSALPGARLLWFIRLKRTWGLKKCGHAYPIRGCGNDPLEWERVSMSTSLLYHGFGIRGYRYVRTEYVEGGVVFTIVQEPKTCRCPAARRTSEGRGRTRQLRGLPSAARR